MCVALFAFGNMATHGNGSDIFNSSDFLMRVENSNETSQGTLEDLAVPVPIPRPAPEAEPMPEPKLMPMSEPALMPPAMGTPIEELCREMPEWEGCVNLCAQKPDHPVCRDDTQGE